MEDARSDLKKHTDDLHHRVERIDKARKELVQLKKSFDSDKISEDNEIFDNVEDFTLDLSSKIVQLEEELFETEQNRVDDKLKAFDLVCHQIRVEKFLDYINLMFHRADDMNEDRLRRGMRLVLMRAKGLKRDLVKEL